MRIAGALLYTALVAIAFASGIDRSSPWWVALVATFLALFLAALIRVHAVINAPREDR
ncbi:hypothetical protein [Curtobacterium sp. USHLN213]|uniref:hypothetical protein n=1 Tax=Curtobacterium sp. USHLN213 TaxID=3081255 RepID=UPI0030175BD6